MNQDGKLIGEKSNMENESHVKDENLVENKNFIEDYGFTNTLDISVGAMLLFYLKNFKPGERHESVMAFMGFAALTAVFVLYD